MVMRNLKDFGEKFSADEKNGDLFNIVAEEDL